MVCLLDRTEDGRYFALAQVGRIQKILLWRTTGLDGTGEAIPFSQQLVSESAPALSPVGRYIAYQYRQPAGSLRPAFPFRAGPVANLHARRRRACLGTGCSELFFSAGDALTRVRVSTSGSFTAGAEERLFDHPGLRIPDASVARYAVSRDGKRFLVVEAQREFARPMLRIVENWFSEFRSGAKR